MLDVLSGPVDGEMCAITGLSSGATQVLVHVTAQCSTGPRIDMILLRCTRSIPPVVPIVDEMHVNNGSDA